MKIFRIVFSLLLIFSGVFTIFFAKNILCDETVMSPKEYNAVLTVWQIDVFEGGRGSRRQFISEVAKSFEKQRTGVFVLVVSHTKQSAEERMEKGEYPDIISFGPGVNVDNFLKLGEEDYSFGKIGSITYAVPWCRGGYVLIENPSAKNSATVVSQSEYTQPLLSAYFNGLDLGEYKIKTPMDAYMDFVSGTAKYLLGTQRDVIRLEARGMQARITPLKDFSDLYQYLAVTSRKEYELSVDFVRFLTGNEVQEKLTRIGMMSAYVLTDYDNASLREIQEQNICVSVSPFYGDVAAKEMQELSKKIMSGDEVAKNKIKKMLCYLENKNKI